MPNFPHGEILDRTGKVRPEIREAAERGVVFDVGHGAQSFSFDTAQKALAANFLPTTISSDHSIYSIESPDLGIDMPTIMSKFLALGVPLPKVVEMSTAKPADVLGFNGKLGTLRPGAEADIVVLDLKHGRFTFSDMRSSRTTIQGEKLLRVHTVVKGGEII
jgi:dihydroorotase